jgi:hypothetical protein
MKKLNQNGFGLVEGILLFVAVAIIGGVGFYVYKASQNNPNSAKSDSQKVEAPKKVVAVKKDPYAGWKSYCDERVKLCFKYPDDWDVSAEYSKERNSTYTSVTNPVATVRVMYSTNYFKDGGIVAETPVLLENTKLLSGYSVAGHSVYINASGYVANLDIINGSVEKNGYEIGKPTNELNNPRFTYNKTAIKLSAWPLDKTRKSLGYMSTEAKAREWFKSSDAKVALQILHSLSKQ